MVQKFIVLTGLYFWQVIRMHSYVSHEILKGFLHYIEKLIKKYIQMTLKSQNQVGIINGVLRIHGLSQTLKTMNNIIYCIIQKSKNWKHETNKFNIWSNEIINLEMKFNFGLIRKFIVVICYQLWNTQWIQENSEYFHNMKLMVKLLHKKLKLYNNENIAIMHKLFD